MPFQMPTGGGQLPPELGALIAQIIGGGGNKTPPPPSRYAGGMPQGVTGGDTGAPAPPPGAPDLTGTQGNTPGGVQGLVLQAMQALLGPGGQLSPRVPGAPNAVPPAPPRPIPPPQAGGAAMGPPFISNAIGDTLNAAARGGGLPPPAAMPGDPASGATRAMKPPIDPNNPGGQDYSNPPARPITGADYQRLFDNSTERSIRHIRPPGAGGSAMGSPDNTMMSQVIRDMVAKGSGASPGDGVPVTPNLVDPRLAASGRPSKVTPPAPRYGTRKVARGDTLSGIAGSNDPNKLRMIAAANPQIRDINRIVAGDTLNIPGQVVGVDRGSQNHPAMAGKKGQAPSGAAKLKSGFLAAAQGSPSQKASGRVKRPAFGSRPIG